MTIPGGNVTQYGIFQEQLKNALSFILASACRLDAVETMFENEPHPSYFRYMALVQAYGRHQLPGQATKVLHCFLHNAPNIVSFDNHIISSVMDAWAIARHPQALEKKLEVMALVETHRRCMELQVRPWPAIFNN